MTMQTMCLLAVLYTQLRLHRSNKNKSAKNRVALAPREKDVRVEVQKEARKR